MDDHTRTTALPSSTNGGPLTTSWYGWCGAWTICNVAFLAVVGWLTAGRDPWWLGLVWSAGYQVVWFIVAYAAQIMQMMRIISCNTTDPPVPKEEKEAMVDEKTSGGTAYDDKSKNKSIKPKPKQTCLALLYGFVVTLFLAVVGWQLPRHAIHSHYTSPTSSTDRDYYYDGYYGDASGPASATTTEWTTDLTRLPVRVQEWWAAASSSTEMVVMDTADNSSPNVVYLPGSMTTIFRDWKSWYNPTITVWSVSPAAPEPVALWTTKNNVDFYYGGGVIDFVRVHDTLACFITSDSTMNDTDNNGNLIDRVVVMGTGGNTVACTDGTVVKTATVTTAALPVPFFPNQRTGPRNLFVDHDSTTTTAGKMVWFIDYYFNDGRIRSDPLLYSMDPVTMAVTLHSEPHEIDHENVLEIDPALHRVVHYHIPTRTWGSVFVTIIITSLPAVVSSFYLFGRQRRQQQQQQQPGPMTTLSSLPHHLHLIVLVTLLAGLSALFLVLGYESSRLDSDHTDGYSYGAKQAFLWLWTMGVGGAAFLFCTVLMMMTDNHHRDDRQNNNNNSDNNNSSSGHKKILRWGRNIGALVYFHWGVAVILMSPWTGDMTRNTFLWCIVFNAVIVAPLTLLGLITQSLFLLLLAAAGVLVDARLLCLEYTTHVLRRAPWSIKALITVAIMGGTGMIVTVALTYWWLRHRYPDVLAVLKASLEPYCGCCCSVATTVQFTAVPSRDDDDNDNDKDNFDYQQAPPIAAAVVAEERNDDAAMAKAAAGTGGMESLANMLRRWADQVDKVRLAHTATASESGNQGAAVA